MIVECDKRALTHFGSRPTRLLKAAGYEPGVCCGPGLGRVCQWESGAGLASCETPLCVSGRACEELYLIFTAHKTRLSPGAVGERVWRIPTKRRGNPGPGT